MREGRRGSLPASLLLFAMILPGSLGAQEAGSKPAVRAKLLEEGETINLSAGESTVIDVPWKVKRISVSDPATADVEVLAADQVLLMGKSFGSTYLMLWSEAEEVWQARVEVQEDVPRRQEDLARLQDELRALFPESTLEVSRSRDVIVVKGRLSRVEHAKQLRSFFERFPYKFLDLTSVAGVQQVQIQVRVAEVSREAIRLLGINAFHTGSHFFGASTIGSASGGAANSISIIPQAGAPAAQNLPFIVDAVGLSPLVTLFTGFPDADLEIFFQALAENQYLRVLAEPNLVALSGEEATFLTGGEFPIPVVQGGANTSTSISIEYKEFGIKLRFRPTVLGDNTLRLEVSPEVSNLSEVGAVTIQGFSVPALVTRKVATTLELRSGQTFAMAGLLNRVSSARSSRVPILGEIPVLGALFRSVRYQAGETELVVIVKASLVEPTSPGKALPMPGISHIPPRHWELYAEGKIEGREQARGLPASAEIKRLGLERLRGPGAWSNYDKTIQQSRSTLKPEIGLFR